VVVRRTRIAALRDGGSLNAVWGVGRDLQEAVIPQRREWSNPEPALIGRRFGLPADRRQRLPTWPQWTWNQWSGWQDL